MIHIGKKCKHCYKLQSVVSQVAMRGFKPQSMVSAQEGQRDNSITK